MKERNPGKIDCTAPSGDASDASPPQSAPSALPTTPRLDVESNPRGGLADLASYARRRMASDRLEHVVFGLLEEAGEVAGKFKRWERGDYGQCDLGPGDTCGCVAHYRFRVEVQGELGDVAFYLAEMCGRMGMTVDEVAMTTLAKLLDRHARGVTKGKGDAR